MASQFSAIRGRNPLAPTNFGNAILANSGNAYQAALQRDQNTLNQQQLGLQTQALGLQRQQADQSAKDSKNAILVSALGLAPKIYGMFSDSATSDAINAGGEGVGGAASAVSAPVSATPTGSGIGGTISSGLDAVKSGASNLFGDNVASGLSMAGLGQGGAGALAGAALGDDDLSRGLIGAAVPAAINIGTALWDGTSVVDSLASSLFPSIGGALGAIGLGGLF